MNPAFLVASPALCKFGLALAAFMQVLDSTIANVSLPAIGGNLGASISQSTWVITSFAVCNAIALPLTGWFVRRFGEVRLFLGATALFTLASIACGAAANMGMLTVSRALQGFVAGPIFPVTQALMISLFPDDKRTNAIVLLTLVGVVAPIVGPILGGWITDSYSWPWIFFINAPIGVFACTVVWSQMRHKPERTQRTPMDYTGLVLLALGVGALQIVLDMGNENDWFDSNFITAAAAVSAVSLAAFLILSFTKKDSIVDLHLFRHRNFTVGTLAYTLSFGVYIGGTVLLPLWLQTQLHYTAVWAGLAMAPLGLAPFIIGPLISRYSHRIDLRVLASLGFASMAGVLFLRSFFNLEVDFRIVANLQFLQGFGLAMFAISATSIMLSDLEPDEISSGTGLSMFVRMLGGSFFVSITTLLWNNRAVVHHSSMAEQFPPGAARTAEAIDSLGAGDPGLAMMRLEKLITEQAYQISFNEVHYAYGMLLLALGVLIWLARPPFVRQVGATAGAGH